MNANDYQKLRAWALAEGLALFPIPFGRKAPTGLAEAHNKSWSKSAADWDAWHSSFQCNFGVSCGPSNIIVVDVDCVASQPQLAVFLDWLHKQGFNPLDLKGHTVRTPTGGLHYYFKIPNEYLQVPFRQPNIHKTVNTRAGNGYVVAPWSYTEIGQDQSVKATGHYVLEGYSYPAPVIMLRHCWPLDPRKTVEAAEGDLAADGYPTSKADRVTVQHAVTAAVEHLERAGSGERNDRLNGASFELGKLVAAGKLREDVAIGLLTDSAARIGLDPAEVPKTIRSGMTSAAARGQAPPESALGALFAVPAPPPDPNAPDRARAHLRPVVSTPLVPVEPLCERLVYAGEITVLSGASGTGKTTLAASIIAASVADMAHFTSRQEFRPSESDILMKPCAWLFISYEGEKQIGRNQAAWFKGMKERPAHTERSYSLAFRGSLVKTKGREAILDEAQSRTISEALADVRTNNPDLSIVIVLDNITAAVENTTDSVQCVMFMRAMRDLADQGYGVLLLAHPPKGQDSDIAGSHTLYSLADVVGSIEVLVNNAAKGGGWTQWLSFSKHREAPNGECLEIKSIRLTEPLEKLPDDWGSGNARARDRMVRDMHLPYVTTMRVRPEHERALHLQNVKETTEKETTVHSTTGTGPAPPPPTAKNTPYVVGGFNDPKAPS